MHSEMTGDPVCRPTQFHGGRYSKVVMRQLIEEKIAGIAD